jgi:hypothetical protein
MIEADVTNADRAWWALFALGDFVNRTRVDDEAEAIGDLICDLLHLARGAALDPAAIVKRALACMEAEASADQDGDMASAVDALRRIMATAASLAPPFRRAAPA